MCVKEPLEPAGYSALLENSVMACCGKLLPPHTLLPHLSSELPKALQKAVLALLQTHDTYGPCSCSEHGLVEYELLILALH